jgi:hypothetical protein
MNERIRFVMGWQVGGGGVGRTSQARMGGQGSRGQTLKTGGGDQRTRGG